MSGSKAKIDMLQAIQDLVLKCYPEDADDDEIYRFAQLQNRFEEKLASLQASSYISEIYLRKLQIFESGLLVLKPDAKLHAMETDSIGKENFWSANGLYQHLCMLKHLVPHTNQATGHLWINAFCFRVVSMSPSNVTPILNIEKNTSLVAPNLTSPSASFVDSSIILTDEGNARCFVQSPRLKMLPKNNPILYITEVKEPCCQNILPSHLTQAFYDIYMFAKHAEKNIIHAALTNGPKWVFFVLTLNKDGPGGKFLTSDIISATDGSSVSQENSSLIAAILAHWTQHSSEMIGINDYFTTRLF